MLSNGNNQTFKCCPFTKYLKNNSLEDSVPDDVALDKYI